MRDVEIVFRLNGREKFANKPKQVSVIDLPSRNTVVVDIEGVVGGSDLDHLVTGCNEARLRATPSTGGTFDEHIAYITTTYRKT